MLLFFIGPDIYGAFALFTCLGHRYKAAAVIISFEGDIALSIGTVEILVRKTGGPLETFLLIVGIVFVHNLDKKVATGGSNMLMIYQVYGLWLVEIWTHLFFYSFVGSCACTFILWKSLLNP